MTPQQQSQALGLTLATVTAIGCVAYEKLVESCSIFIIFCLATLFYLPATVYMIFYQKQSVQSDLSTLWGNWGLIFAAAIYFLSWITTPLWFFITKKQGVLVGSIYEIKYIIILVMIYSFFGDKPITTNTYIGIFLAICSVWFISKA